MFIVLSSRHNHCENLPGLFDESSTSDQAYQLLPQIGSYNTFTSPIAM